jgi:hypothetical protein
MALCAHCTGPSYGDIVSVMPLGLRQDLVAHYALHSSLFTLHSSLFTLHSSLFTLHSGAHHELHSGAHHDLRSGSHHELHS